MLQDQDQETPPPIRMQSIEPFDFKSEFERWLTRFERYRIVSGLKKRSGEEQVHALVFLMGAQAEDIFESFHLSTEESKNYDQVISRFKKYFVPKANVIYERVVFNRRVQNPGESITDFITALHKLSSSCSYGDLREELVRDQIVVGIRDKQLSERLQLDNNLTLSTAVTLVKQYESVKSQNNYLSESRSDSVKCFPVSENSTVDKVWARNEFRPNEPVSSSCSRCGYFHSASARCPAQHGICSYCKRKGHFVKMCKKKLYNKRGVQEVQNEETSGQNNTGEFVYSVHSKDDDKWSIVMSVNTRKIKFKIDSGADVTVLPAFMLKDFSDKTLDKSTNILSGAGENKLNVLGSKVVSMFYKRKRAEQRIFFVEGLRVPLLGKPAIEKFELLQR
uniref:Peptidase A2 domain-containing protein n=1 Tax=Cacopsylla melanoneura TaxID=428564 RepID=A0A8D8ZQS0_9HEMI